MGHRSIEQITRPQPQAGGLLRPFPSRRLRHVDPFVFVDMAPPEQIGGGSHVVAPHAHRGVQPVGLVFQGRVEHRDSLGNRATVTSGGMQWLVAGSGVLHEEILAGAESGILHAAQLWVNLPAALKTTAPEHHAISADQIPVASLGHGASLRLYAGTVGGLSGPAPSPTPLLLAHITLAGDGYATVPIPAGWNAAVTAVAGKPAVADEPLYPGHTVVFADDGVSVAVAGHTGGELLLMAGQPLGEPIFMGGGHVMNTPEEIEEASEDERAGRMGQLSATPTREVPA